MNITKFFRAAIAMTALVLGVAQTAKADIVTVTGDTTGAATANFSWLGYAGTGAYKAFTFNLAVDGAYSFFLTADFDSVLILYQGAFDPSNTSLNYAADSDDAFLGVPGSGAIGGLAPAGIYTAVITGYDNDAKGPFSLTVGGPSVALVPEPATWLMLAMGLAAVGYAQRRRTLR